MGVNVGSVVTFEGDFGRVCCINSFQKTACVQFEDECLVIPLSKLVEAVGNPPACKAECTGGC